jgi:hypothetical protein
MLYSCNAFFANGVDDDDDDDDDDEDYSIDCGMKCVQMQPIKVTLT